MYDVAELPGGRLVCALHAAPVCHRCGVDFSFTWEDSDEEEQSGRTTSMTGYRESTPHDTPNTPSRILPNLPRGTGRTFPSEFTPWPETVTPMELFSRRRQVGLFTRLVHRGDPQACLVFTDGACLGNGGANPRAGWAFVHGKSGKGRNATYHIVQNRLERTGVFGVGRTIQTSNRAELRAVIAALRFNNWRSEGFRRLVIATDSEYVVEGATNWARSWVRRGWCTRTGDPVKNKDLWELLLGQVERSRSSGLEVELWRVPREWNEVADEAAKEAAAEGGAPLEFHDVVGLEFLWNAG
ncbi:ribonuclease H-like protein [Gonapodya prolifera JEL478]|uniref:ribonuclease H n=1 Tax=Gonapodya prolifera (strain JEL478) TaxID=1344416 RepID=A0A139ALB4_GONPJ|nr:ribonuclease H-like protein [Gonapodya prolifera JEL478]|eukprot:KXS17303.1 ribonuclease H-like protein [Gonapodya prolifera JEL478]